MNTSVVGPHDCGVAFVSKDGKHRQLKIPKETSAWKKRRGEGWVPALGHRDEETPNRLVIAVARRLPGHAPGTYSQHGTDATSFQSLFAPEDEGLWTFGVAKLVQLHVRPERDQANQGFVREQV